VIIGGSGEVGINPSDSWCGVILGVTLEDAGVSNGTPKIEMFG